MLNSFIIQYSSKTERNRCRICSLIAILLGRLRLSAAEAIEAYEELAGKVFSEKKAPGKDGTFKASKLEEAVKSVLEARLGKVHADDRMYEEGITNDCRT